MAEKSNYHLLDSRIGTMSINKVDNVLKNLSDEWEKHVLYSGTATECCQYANNKQFGALCVVADDTEILYHWLSVKSKKWAPHGIS